MDEYNIVVLGGGGVGKSCITIQFIKSKFIDEYDPTIEDSYRKEITIKENRYILNILDTAGQDEYSAMRDQYIQNGDGFIIVYSITSRESFDEIVGFRDQIVRIKDDDGFPMVLCGNKSDLNNQRQVSYIDGNNLSKSFNIKFFEVSAFERSNVDEIFTQLTLEMIIYHEPIIYKKASCKCIII